MTTIALSQLVHQAPAFLERITHQIAAFFAGLDDAREMAHRYKTLSQMSDVQLAALGLTRQDIPQAVLDLTVRA
jgi:uncharacterized protein YjiS (DUF1127 family)